MGSKYDMINCDDCLDNDSLIKKIEILNIKVVEENNLRVQDCEEIKEKLQSEIDSRIMEDYILETRITEETENRIKSHKEINDEIDELNKRIDNLKPIIQYKASSDNTNSQSESNLSKDNSDDTNEQSAKEKAAKEKAAKEKAAKEKAAEEKAAKEKAAEEKAERELAAKEKAAKEKAAREKAAKEKAAEEKAERELAAKEKAAREKAAEEKAAREKAAKEKAAKEKAAREKAAREKAAKEKAAKEKAAEEKAAKEKAAKEKAAKEKAAKEKAAEEKAAREKAAKEKAAKEKAAKEKAAKEKDAKEKAAKEKAAKEKAAKEKAERDAKLVSIEIKDAGLRKHLLENYYSYEEGNTVKIESKLVQKLDLSDKKDITSLEGIENFVNLYYLNISNTNLSSIDLTKNPSLTEVICNKTNLYEIDLTPLDNLTKFDATNNFYLTYVYVNNVNSIPEGWSIPSYSKYKSKNEDSLFNDFYFEEILKPVNIKAERPFTFYGKIDNYNINKGDIIGIFEGNFLIGKYEFQESKTNGAITVNLYPIDVNTDELKIVLKSDNTSNQIFTSSINFTEGDSNYQNIPNFSIKELPQPKKESNLKLNKRLYTIPSELVFRYLN